MISSANLHDDFATTHWSIVLSAGQSQNPSAAAALAELCQRYWLPLFAYVRRREADLHAAQDLTQGFFAHLLDKQSLAAASPDRGRFRSFLLTALKHFLANERDKAQAQKRGGQLQRLSLDWDSGESRLNLEPSHDLTPERHFERQWALTLLDHVVEQLQAEFDRRGHARHFDLLQPALAGDRAALDYAAIATELGVSEDAARQSASRLRKRYRELLRQEVAQTVASPAEIDDELRSLLAALS